MKIVSLAAQKGGVGKTTTAVNLAVAAQLAGIKTILLDLDPQESATAWAERRTDELPHVEPMSARRLPQAIEAAKAAGFELMIIDTPPAAGTEAAEAVTLSDLALIPVRPSLIDLEAIKRTAQLIRATGTPGIVLLNACQPTAKVLPEQAREFAEANGLQVAAPILRERIDYRGSWQHGQGVVEYVPEEPAAGEIWCLLDFIIDSLQITKPAKTQTRRSA